jgi:signal transduction histidine kinase
MQGKSLINAIRASGSGQVACYLRDAEDVSFWTTVTGTWASGPTGESIVLMVSDIDDLHQRSLLLEEALDFERRTNELQRRYLAFAAHDFRTPLAIIDSSAQKILRKVQDKPLASVAQAASKIRDTVQRLLNLTDATIGKARKGIGLSGLDFGRGDLAALLRSVVDFQKDLHRDVSIDLRIEDLGLVSFDALLIEQALSNVLSNSIKYSGSVKKVEITAEKRGTNIILCFRDWGIGIPVDQLETIFTAHSRGENVGMIPGTGLGLSIARQIFEMHQGTLRVAETSPAGSTFEIIIPTRAQPSQAND